MTDPTPTPPPPPPRKHGPPLRPRTTADWRALEAAVPTMTRADCLYVLAWNDTNGCFTDAACEREGLRPLTTEEARAALADVCLSV